MKRFEDLSDPEIAALSERDVAFYCDFACAENGAPIALPEPGVMPSPPEMTEDLTVYNMGGMVFKNAEDAEKVASLARTFPRMKANYVSSGNLHKQVAVASDESVSVVPDQHYSGEKWERIKSSVVSYAAAKKQYEEDTEAYEKASKERDAATTYVREKVARVRREVEETGRMVAVFDRYVELAAGNLTMARAFLLKAHPEAEKYLPPVEAEALPA